MRAPVSIGSPWVVVCAVALLLLCDVPIPIHAERYSSAVSYNCMDQLELLIQDEPELFAMTASVVVENVGTHGPLTCAAGVRTKFATAPQPGNIPNDLNAAYRMNTMSEFFVVMAVMYLEDRSLLPFDRDIPIANLYLPPYFSNETHLSNPHYPGVPITLNMLMTHTSSLNENGFQLGTAQTPNGKTTLLTTFVDSLFQTEGDAIFSNCQPGVDVCYKYSRTNVALLSYIVEKVLIQGNISPNIGAYILSTLLLPLGMTQTFIINQIGRRPAPSYPLGMADDTVGLVAIQDVVSNGNAIQRDFSIHAAYTADYMFYSTTTDLATVASAVLVPGGLYYKSIGTRMLRRFIKIPSGRNILEVGRGYGVYSFSTGRICNMMDTIVNNGSTSSDRFRCRYDAVNLPSDTPPYGISVTGTFSQVAIVCIPSAIEGVACGVASASYFEATPSAMTKRRSTNVAVAMATYGAAEMTSYIPTDSFKRVNGFGAFIFVGVVAVIIVVVAGSYIADYLIQPAPPANVVVPIPTLNVQGGAAGEDGGGGGGAGASGAVSRGGGLSPAYRYYSGAKADRSGGGGGMVNGRDGPMLMSNDTTPMPLRLAGGQRLYDDDDDGTDQAHLYMEHMIGQDTSEEREEKDDHGYDDDDDDDDDDESADGVGPNEKELPSQGHSRRNEREENNSETEGGYDELEESDADDGEENRGVAPDHWPREGVDRSSSSSQHNILHFDAYI